MISRARSRLHVFPRLTQVAYFPALDAAGYMFLSVHIREVFIFSLGLNKGISFDVFVQFTCWKTVTRICKLEILTDTIALKVEALTSPADAVVSADFVLTHPVIPAFVFTFSTFINVCSKNPSNLR